LILSTPRLLMSLVEQESATASLLELQCNLEGDGSSIEMQLLEQCISRSTENASKLAWASALIQEISLLLILLPPDVQVQLLRNQLPTSLREKLTTVLMARDEVLTVKVADAISASQAMVGLCIPFLCAFLAGSSWEQLQNKLERFAAIHVDEMPTGSDSSATLVVEGISSDDLQAFLSIFCSGALTARLRRRSTTWAPSFRIPRHGLLSRRAARAKRMATSRAGK